MSESTNTPTIQDTNLVPPNEKETNKKSTGKKRPSSNGGQKSGGRTKKSNKSGSEEPTNKKARTIKNKEENSTDLQAAEPQTQKKKTEVKRLQRKDASGKLMCLSDGTPDYYSPAEEFELTVGHALTKPVCKRFVNEPNNALRSIERTPQMARRDLKRNIKKLSSKMNKNNGENKEEHAQDQAKLDVLTDELKRLEEQILRAKEERAKDGGVGSKGKKENRPRGHLRINKKAIQIIQNYYGTLLNDFVVNLAKLVEVRGRKSIFLGEVKTVVEHLFPRNKTFKNDNRSKFIIELEEWERKRNEKNAPKMEKAG